MSQNWNDVEEGLLAKEGIEELPIEIGCVLRSRCT
jgi:hypothetical protein